MPETYYIHPVDKHGLLKADWDHPLWQDIPVLNITHFQGKPPIHRPVTQARLAYAADGLMGIFQVQDQFVRAVATQINGEVWKDSCVEFFFTPDSAPGTAYFNLEINCCGIALLRHQTAPLTQIRYVDPQDNTQMMIVSSIPHKSIPKEIETPLTWTLVFLIPFRLLQKYYHFEIPESGDCWRGNFYKCADETSQPHWLTWSPVSCSTPDFHRPDSFGLLRFL